MVSRPSVFFKNIENFNLENTSSVDNKFESSVLVTLNAPSNDAWIWMPCRTLHTWTAAGLQTPCARSYASAIDTHLQTVYGKFCNSTEKAQKIQLKI